MLSQKKIIVGVSGSIAAYKSAILVRLLVKSGAEVKVVMTESAKDFITTPTLATLSKTPVLSDFIKDSSGSWNNHVDLGLWADAIILAPASANTLAKFANGICDNLLCAVYLSARCSVFLAPAMDLDMYLHPSTRQNLKLLRSYGNQIIDAEHGELASGLVGTGRMAEPENIVSILDKHFSKGKPLEGKQVLITAGPTHEAIDPVRFIGNNSSGKMGYALAHEAASLGAHVKLISGPTAQHTSDANVHKVCVSSAEEMYQACAAEFDNSDIIIHAAAVADYTPKVVSDKKIKKNGEDLNIELTRTKDIAGELGKIKKDKQLVVGFALETHDEEKNALGKLEKKNFDFIVLNSLQDPGAGFAHDTNKITILDKDNNRKEFELKSKDMVASDIFEVILSKINV